MMINGFVFVLFDPLRLFRDKNTTLLYSLRVYVYSIIDPSDTLLYYKYTLMIFNSGPNVNPDVNVCKCHLITISGKANRKFGNFIFQ